MSIEVETVVAVSVMMAVFSAVAAIGTSIVLGAGFERLRGGFEVIRKQTGFFSDAIHKLEEKMIVVDGQTGKFSHAITIMEEKVNNVGDQANSFTSSMQQLERKVEVVDKQAGFFGDAIHRLEDKIDMVNEHENILSDKIASHADMDITSVSKTETLVSHAEELLTQVSEIADKISEKDALSQGLYDAGSQSHGFAHYTHMQATDAEEGMRYN